jgi:replicative DNA helicase
MNHEEVYLEGILKSMMDEKAEKAVLAVLLQFKNIYHINSNQLSENLFWKGEHKLIFRAIVLTATEGKPIDIVTVSDTIFRHGLNKIAPQIVKSDKSLISTVSEISGSWSSDSHFESHLHILKESYQRRKLYELSSSIQKRCIDTKEPEEIINYINSEVVSMTIQQEKDFNAEEIVNEVILDMSNPVAKNILPTRILKLDEEISGFEFGDLVIVGGAASMGKTAFSLRLFKNFIDSNLHPVYFSLEMSKAQLITRLIASEAEIHLSSIRRRQLAPNQVRLVHSTGLELAKQKFIIDDRTRSLENILNKIRICKIKYGTKVIILDYLQLATTNIGKKGSNREQEIALISRSLKEIANELSIVVIALSQLSRQVNSRDSKKPMLSDLRESGSIEQDADFVLFPFRPDYYRMLKGEIPKPSFCEDAELIIAKGRSTGVGTVSLKFISTFTKYLNDEDAPPVDTQFIETTKQTPAGDDLDF